VIGQGSNLPPRGRRGDLVAGRLEAHGPANYQFEPDGSPSYYVRLVSTRGVETLWGRDLERALKRSKTQPKLGSIVGVRRIGAELVTVPPTAGGTTQPRTLRRTRWMVESIGYYADAARRAHRDVQVQIEDRRALTERPELRSAYITLSAAQQFADEHIHDPRDRELFVRRVKAVMAASARSTAGRPSQAPKPSSSDRDPPSR
jgi:hypothetical protein